MKLNLAERWVVNNPLRYFQQQIEVRLLKRMMPLASGATVLEIGCGRGAGAHLILRAFQPLRLHILDLDIRMIQMADLFLAAVPRDRLRLYVGDSIDLPLRHFGG